MIIQKLTQKNAQNIAYRWKYKAGDARYTLSKDPASQQEFVSQKLRKQNFFEVIDEGKLFGYLQVEDKEDGLWITFGMRPELTGQGRGQAFLDTIMDFIREKYGIDKPLMLAVGLFNERAIHLFKKNKFYDIQTRKFNFDEGRHDYVVLRRDW